MAAPPSTPPATGTGTATAPPVAFGKSRLSKLMPGTGTSSVVRAGVGANRRTVVLTTRCNTLALRNRRMVRLAPGTGSGGWEYAGTGTHRRKVVEYAECRAAGKKPGTGTTPSDLGPYVPPTYSSLPGGAVWGCCSNEFDGFGVPMPDKLSAYIARIATCTGQPPPRQCCIDLDDFAVTLYFQYISVSAEGLPLIAYQSKQHWITVTHPLWLLGPGLVPVYSGTYREVVSVQVSLIGICKDETLYWTIGVVGYPASGLGFWTFNGPVRPNPGNHGMSSCAYPFPIYFGGGSPGIYGPGRLYLERGLGTYTYDPCNIGAGLEDDEYKVVITAPLPSSTVTLPGYPANVGTGTGTGTHLPGGKRPYFGVTTPKASTGMSKWFGYTANGRAVFGQACCSGTGTASNTCHKTVSMGTGTVSVPCKFAMLMHDDTGQCCLNGTITLNQLPNQYAWTASASCNGCTWNFLLTFDGYDWSLDITDSCGCGTRTIAPLTVASRHPLDLTGTVLFGGCTVTTGCFGANMHFDFTPL